MAKVVKTEFDPSQVEFPAHICPAHFVKDPDNRSGHWLYEPTGEVFHQPGLDPFSYECPGGELCPAGRPVSGFDQASGEDFSVLTVMETGAGDETPDSSDELDSIANDLPLDPPGPPSLQTPAEPTPEPVVDPNKLRPTHYLDDGSLVVKDGDKWFAWNSAKEKRGVQLKVADVIAKDPHPIQ